VKYMVFDIEENWDKGGRAGVLELTKGKDVYCLMFDLTDRNSYYAVIRKIHETSNVLTTEKAAREGREIRYVLVGTKSDLEEERKVSKMEARDFARAMCIPYVEISAMSGENCEHLLTYVIPDALTRKAMDWHSLVTRGHLKKDSRCILS